MVTLILSLASRVGSAYCLTKRNIWEKVIEAQNQIEVYKPWPLSVSLALSQRFIERWSWLLSLRSWVMGSAYCLTAEEYLSEV